MENGERWVLLGEFGRAHGLRGEVRLKSFTGDPSAIARYGTLRTERGEPLVLSGVRPAPGAASDMLVARIKGVASREAAEALNRIRVFAPRDSLGAPEADEFFLADLIGLAAEDEAGAYLGRIVAMPDYGGGELIEIAPAVGGPTVLVPFTRAFAPVVDVAAGRVVVVLPVETAGEDDDEPR